MRGTWRELHERAPPGSIDYLAWRRGVVDALLALPHECVVFSHYISINVAAGAAQQRDEVVCFRPDHASVTLLDATAGRLQLVELGREAQTAVLTR
jgi:hypothetical protein